MAKFIVDRRTWYRGKGWYGSALLRVDGTRCCIGFVGAQCGVSDERLLGRATVLHSGISNWPTWMTRVGIHDDITLLYEINDDIHISDAERETLIQERFRRHGDEIEFVN